MLKRWKRENQGRIPDDEMGPKERSVFSMTDEEIDEIESHPWGIFCWMRGLNFEKRDREKEGIVKKRGSSKGKLKSRRSSQRENSH
jgi:hypothetical protein